MAFTKTIEIPGQLGADTDSDQTNQFNVVALGQCEVYLTVSGHAHKHPTLDSFSIITKLTAEKFMEFMQALAEAGKQAGISEFAQAIVAAGLPASVDLIDADKAEAEL